jgi:hypothetical protein
MLVNHVQSMDPPKYLYSSDKYLAYNVKLMFYNIRNYYIIKYFKLFKTVIMFSH